jgi:micrococcal nuclease|tara:strand:- start:108 stop:602 length:495 start_codon:yes stop_codon:yes gene_type:complete
MYEYRCKVLKVVDGDTADVDIDLGFGIVLTDERVRLMGIDTPESRTSDKVEDLFGEAAKARLKELIAGTSGPILRTQINKDGEDMKGKFGRILGDFSCYHAQTDSWRMATEILIEEGHAVPYMGGSKDDTQAAHEVNRQRLLEEGVVAQADYDKQVEYMAKKNS